MSYSTTYTSSSLQNGLSLALQQLSLFAQSPNFLECMTVAFGDGWSPDKAQSLVETLAVGKYLPQIVVVASSEIGGGIGAYEVDRNRIYLSEQFVSANRNNPQAIATVLLEEIGHTIDSRLNPRDSVGDEGAIFAAFVNNQVLSNSELAVLKTENDSRQVLLDGKLRTIEQATYGSINVDGILTDWLPTERIDNVAASGTPSNAYQIYGKYAANTYLFAINRTDATAAAVGANTTIWLNTDRNRATGYQIWGFAGGAEYNINIDSAGVTKLFTGADGQTFVSNLDSVRGANGWEVAVPENLLGSPTAIDVLADVNNSVFLPGDYSTNKLTVSQSSPPAPKTIYGDITLDGSLVDWTQSSRLDVLPGSGRSGYEVYGKNTIDGYAFAIKSAVEIAADTTFWLNTDQNRATGYQIWGFAGGAEYSINIDGSGNAYLYSGNTIGQNLIGQVDAKLSLDKKTLEVAVSKDRVVATGSGTGINVLADVNNTVFLPGDYSSTPYTVSSATTNTSRTVYGSITLDGSLTDWKSTERLDFLPGTGQPGYQIYGKGTADGYVFALNSATTNITTISNNTTIWLDTDQNKATGYQVFPQANGAGLGGAEYSINLANVTTDSTGKAIGDAYLYQAQDAKSQVLVAKLDTKFSNDGKTWEVAINKNILPVAGAGINVLADVNDSIFLPGDYSRSAYSISNTPVVRTDLSKKVGIVYSETSASNYFNKTAYSQLFMSAQEEAMMAGIPFDLLSEADLKDINKLVNYDTLVFPSFQNVAKNDLLAIQDSLNQAVFQHGISIIAAGNFMTNDESGAALPDAYSRMNMLLNVKPEAFGSSTVSLTNAGNPLLQGYSAGETIRSYNPMGWNAYSSVDPAKTTILANQTVSTGTYGAVVATQTGGNNVHFASESYLGDTQLLQQALQWTTYDNQPNVKLSLTRNNSLFTSRNDMDLSQENSSVKPTNGTPGVYDRLLPIVEQWKKDYNFVGSYYINIGNNQAGGDFTDWAVSKPYYDRLLTAGNEIGTHSYTHFYEYQGYNPPENTNVANDAQLEFEFRDSRDIIGQQLGIKVTGAALPGAPETVETAQKILPYFDYISGGYSGVGGGYPGAFGYLKPGQSSVYLAPNLYFDFTLIEFGIPVYNAATGTYTPKKLTAAEAKAEWIKQLNEVTSHADKPIVMMPWHDYGPTNWSNSGYNTDMFTGLIQTAFNSGAEFTTLNDVSQRIETFEQSKLLINSANNSITATVTPAAGTSLGKFALDLNPGVTISSVNGWYAYDEDSVFLPAKGGTYTINLGAVSDVSHITAFDQRNELISVAGDGTNLSFNFNGSGKVSTDMKAITSDQRYKITGADSFNITGDKVSLTFNANTNHTASIAVVANNAPQVKTRLSDVVTTSDVAPNRVIDLSNLFSDIDGDLIVKSVVGNTNTNLLIPTINGNSLTLQYQPYEFGTSTITVRGSDGNKTVDTSFNVTLNSVSPVVNGTNNADTLNGTNNGEIIKGLLGNDRLNGNSGNDVLIGGGGNDSLFGGTGNDVLLGANPLSVTPGQGSYDVLQGDAGSDRYILGDVNAIYYNDGNNANTGRTDYAAIIGFSAAQGDVIQLKGKAADYSLALGTAPNTIGLGTLIQSTLFGQPELIGFVAGVSGLTLNSVAFSYV